VKRFIEKSTIFGIFVVVAILMGAISSRPGQWIKTGNGISYDSDVVINNKMTFEASTGRAAFSGQVTAEAGMVMPADVKIYFKKDLKSYIYFDTAESAIRIYNNDILSLEIKQ